MWTLAYKTLLHDRTKFAVATLGVSVSVLLVLVQVGLYFGFMQNASNLVDHSTADLWVSGEGNEGFDFAGPIDERLAYRVAETPGVAAVEKVILAFGNLKLGGGGNQRVEIVGLERGARLLAPWNVVDGSGAGIAEVAGVVVDRSELAKLEVSGVGDRREIGGARSRVVALTDGIRSFTASPFVFTNLESSRAYARVGSEQITYVLVRAEPGADVEALRARLDTIPDVDAYTRADLSARTRSYWSKRTGVGTGFFMTAAMGVLVGLVVVGQILYNGTLEHLKEYGTLKAMGVPNAAVVRTILWQAVLSAVMGYAVGLGLALLAREGVRAANLTVVLSPGLLVATAALTVTMCAAAALLSIRRILELDPASVLKG